MMTIESIKSEIIKLNNKVNEYTRKHCKLNENSKNYDVECAKIIRGTFYITELIDSLSDMVFEKDYGIKFYWEEDDCKFSSSVIKIGEEMFISGDALFDSELESILRHVHYGIGTVFMSAIIHQIKLRFEFFKFK